MANNRKLRTHIISRWRELKQERDRFTSQWMEISRFVTPASGRFFNDGESRNEARERWNRIYNSTATRAVNIFASGLMSGMSDPSTQWFALTTGTPDLDESQPVKLWLAQVQRILEMAFSRTNTYQALHHGWREIGCYGVSACIIVEDPKYGFNCHPLCVGEYCIGCDYRGMPDTLYRKFKMTIGQVVLKYGLDKVSRNVRTHYENGQVDKKISVFHAIEPRWERDASKADNRNMPYRSVVMLCDTDPDSDGILEESGYHEFPAVVGRWGASATDVYSEEAPGMVAIGDVKQLQHMELQEGNVIDHQVDPALILPTSALHSEINFLPGGRTYIDNPTQANQVQRAFAVDLPLRDLDAKIAKVENHINQAFSVDMFLMLAGNTAAGQMTATEVAERHSEKLMMLGPVISRLNREVLSRLIDRAFNILYRQGVLPPAPEELQGKELNVEYTSMLARSQREIHAQSTDKFLTVVGQIAQFKPEVLNKLDGNALVDEYADYYSVTPTVIVPSDKANEATQEQMRAQEQAQQAQAMQQGVDNLSKLGKIPNDGTVANDTLRALSQQIAAQGDTQAQEDLIQ